MNDSKKYGEIDRISFQLGMINCFVEMVACGVKKLAISPPLTPEDYKKIRPASDEIVRGFGIRSYLEKALLVTGLQSENFTKGKWSILYYKTDDVLRDYLDLKAMKKQLEEEERYNDDCRNFISRKFMQLLSYPEDVIDNKLAGTASDPFMLIDI
jgi:hypothetical protein